jgi:hypothetical protein
MILFSDDDDPASQVRILFENLQNIQPGQCGDPSTLRYHRLYRPTPGMDFSRSTGGATPTRRGSETNKKATEGLCHDD